MDFEKLKKRAYVFFWGLYVQLIQYRRAIEKPADWIERKIRDHKISKAKNVLTRMQEEAEIKYQGRRPMGNVRREFLKHTGEDVVPVIFKKKAKNWWRKGSKFTFLIRPLKPEDLVNAQDLLAAVQKMIGQGISTEKAALQYAETLKENLNKLTPFEVMMFLLERGVVYPKIVNKEEPLGDDELPLARIPLEMKTALMQQILDISPIFNKK